MKTRLFTILTITLLTSCVGTKKFTGFIEPKFQDTIEIDSTHENISFDLTKLINDSSSVTTTKVKSQFIPAVLYWKWNNTIKCDVNPFIVGQLFQRNFLQYADTLHLAEKLHGQKLKLTVEQVPRSFVYKHKGHTIIFILAYTVSDMEAIFPPTKDLVVTYELKQDDFTVKTGKFITSNNATPVSNVWKSTKKLTWLYIDQFKQNAKAMAKEIVEKLVTEI